MTGGRHQSQQTGSKQTERLWFRDLREDDWSGAICFKHRESEARST